ncbi:MFS transporter [Microbacterium sp. bgisy189]|uniref:MFS transporter n=1 Tax=Microbacterium sp. bgisy189 TaxID=3413798 RepID=UPI003EBF3E4E
MTIAPTGVWRPPFGWVTAGAVAMVFLAATQALAVTTVMPAVSEELDGAGLYAVAFSGVLAASVVGMVVVGVWCDRAEPAHALTLSVALFVLGLVVAGAAPDMTTLVVGRLIQGLGTGGQTVALYVVVARVYPSELHGRVMAAFSAAWVVPSLVGPAVAGAVTEYLHWRWVFFGVAALAVIAFTIVYLRLHGTPLRASEVDTGPYAVRVLCSVVVAVGAVGLSLAGEFGALAPLVAGASLVIVVIAVRPLLPPGTLTVRRGLPSVVLMRALIAGALFGAEIYVPYLLVDRYGFSTTFAGFGLTAAALLWAAGAEVQGRFGDHLGSTRIAVIGVSLLTAATVLAFITAALGLPPAVVIGGWSLAGAGMGLMYPRLTVLTLAYSTPQNQGFNSAALSISDAAGAAAAIAAMGVAFVALTGSGAAFPAVFLLAAALALLALVPGLRLSRVSG